jgi:tetratricopeptide (TPR) repeat protein
MNRMRTAMLTLTIASFPLPAFAQPDVPPAVIRVENLSVQEVLAIAARLIDAGQLNEAEALLDQLAADRNAGGERTFLKGLIAMARKDYMSAEAAFRAMLAADPGLLRVRLELARTLFLALRDEQADYQFRLAMAQRPPEAVLRTIAAFRETIRARRSWRLNLEWGIAPDSNINSATDKEQIDLIGLPFALDRDGRARSGTGLYVATDASVRLLRHRRNPLYLAAYGRVLRYEDKRFNDVYAGGEAGPEFRLSGGRLRTGAVGFIRGYGGRRLVTSIGGRLHFEKVIAALTTIETTLSVRHNAYARREDVDGWDIEAGLAVNRAVSPSAIGFVWTSAQRSIARDPGQSSWQGRVGLGLLKEMRWGLRPRASIEVGWQANDAPLALFGKVRRDWRLHATASIYKRDWNVMGFAPSVRLGWTRNWSTIPLYDQKRVRAEFAMERAF